MSSRSRTTIRAMNPADSQAETASRFLDPESRAPAIPTQSHAPDLLDPHPARSEDRSCNNHGVGRAASPEPLFASFFIGGFECSCQINSEGVRLDMTAALHHDVHAAEDYARLRTV